MDEDRKYIMKSASKMKIRGKVSPINYTRRLKKSSTSVLSLDELLGVKGRMTSSRNPQREIAHCLAVQTERDTCMYYF